MSSTRTETCDGCGRTRTKGPSPLADEMLPPANWWSMQMSSRDEWAVGHGLRLRFVHWDLCADCAAKAKAVTIEAVGQPSSDQSEDE